uniref:ENR1 protein n=1 Tax=Cyanoderma ruficeps TaxID=181631 RepID=A0A8C3QXQ4_9PASS
MESTQTWKGKIWTPEEIVKTYGPATWAQEGSWGYRTPIYMLNKIIQLQAVLEIVSNKTALALDQISNQLAQTRAVVYQIRLAVDYLLADEGGICGKFNSSECCLEIDDKSEEDVVLLHGSWVKGPCLQPPASAEGMPQRERGGERESRRVKARASKRARSLLQYIISPFVLNILIYSDQPARDTIPTGFAYSL